MNLQSGYFEPDTTPEGEYIYHLEQAIKEVKRLHIPVNVEPSDTICRECSYQLPSGRFFGKLVEHPCPTIQALGETE